MTNSPLAVPDPGVSAVVSIALVPAPLFVTKNVCFEPCMPVIVVGNEKDVGKIDSIEPASGGASAPLSETIGAPSCPASGVEPASGSCPELTVKSPRMLVHPAMATPKPKPKTPTPTIQTTRM
jgi:hypothetical protein